MATDAEARAAGFATPVGTNLISGGDDAIRQNARTALDLTNAARFVKPFAGTGGDLDNYITPGLHGYWNDTANIPPTDEPVSGNVLVLPPPAGTGTALTQIAFPYGMSSTQWKRFKGTGGFSAWVRMDAGAIDLSALGGGGSAASPAAFKTVPLALTAGGSAAAGPTSGIYRMPIKFGATITRWRAHFRNINPRFGTDGPPVALPSVHFGKATAGQFTETSTRVGSASISTDTAGVATAWQSTPILAGVEYALSYQFSGTATNRVIGGGWSASSVNSPTATLSRTDRLPLDVWIEAEISPGTPVIAVLGDSLAVGVGATLPVYDSWLSQWARANGALPVHYATSGDTMAGWADSNAYKWQRWQGLTRPDAVIHAMGNNDVFGGADLSTMRTRRIASIEQLQQLVSPVIYSATITPRTSSTGDQEDIRRQYNIWLKLFPDAARAVFDFVPAISSDDENIGPGFDADGIHLNTAGYAAVAGTIAGPLTPTPSTSDRLTALEYDSGLREIGHLATGLISGTIRMRVRRGWAQMTLVDARFEAGGTLTVFSSGGQLSPWAPETPGADVRGWALDASTGLTCRAEIANSGALYLRNAPANKALQGSILWPFTRPVPATPIGNPI